MHAAPRVIRVASSVKHASYCVADWVLAIEKSGANGHVPAAHRKQDKEKSCISATEQQGTQRALD